MPFAQSIKVYIVSSKEFKKELDILWDGKGDEEHNQMQMWATLEDAQIEKEELQKVKQDPLQIYEVNLSVIGVAE